MCCALMSCALHVLLVRVVTRTVAEGGGQHCDMFLDGVEQGKLGVVLEHCLGLQGSCVGEGCVGVCRCVEAQRGLWRVVERESRALKRVGNQRRLRRIPRDRLHVEFAPKSTEMMERVIRRATRQLCGDVWQRTCDAADLLHTRGEGFDGRVDALQLRRRQKVARAVTRGFAGGERKVAAREREALALRGAQSLLKDNRISHGTALHRHSTGTGTGTVQHSTAEARHIKAQHITSQDSMAGRNEGKHIREHRPWAWGRSLPACAPLMASWQRASCADRARGFEAAPLQACSEVARPWPVSLCIAQWVGCCPGVQYGTGTGTSTAQRTTAQRKV